METTKLWTYFLTQMVPFILTVIIALLAFRITKYLLNRQGKGEIDKGIIRSIILFVVGLIVAIVIILALPISGEIKSQISSLIGIVIAAVLSLSSATFIGNGLAGIMIRAVDNFKPGDFIQVEDIFGRISERGLFHTEIQTVDRDLTTVPNLFLANNPVKVKRSSGTFISATCSLGYDVSRLKIETCLIEAAKAAGLTEPFVHITELGDFSVVYKVHGLLEDVKTILSARSRLHGQLLDHLHKAGIEIVSPGFVNQRQVNEAIFIPKKAAKKEIEEAQKREGQKTEAKIFDKADEAESIEARKAKVSELDASIKNMEEELKLADAEKKVILQKRIEEKKDLRNRMTDRIDTKLEELDSKD